MMELQLDPEVQGSLLVVAATGKVQCDAAMRQFRRVLETAAASRVTKILVNALSVEGDLPSHERYALGSELAAYATELGLDARIALVGAPPAVNGFAVRIAGNRGMAAEVFSTVEGAMRWLGELPDPVGGSRDHSRKTAL